MQVGNKQLIVIGDRVLIKQERADDRTAIGLYLPQSVLDKDSVAGGRIVSTGPGTAIPSLTEIDNEPWKEPSHEPRYIPMQASPGDYAIYLRKEGVEIKFEGEKYIIVPQGAVLVLVRDSAEDS